MRTICGSSLLSIAMSGVRERMIASKSRNGLSVSVTFVEAEVADGKFKVLKARGILGAFKEKGARVVRPLGKLAQNAGERPRSVLTQLADS